jgi:iron complex outermembrane receptor protein
LARAAAAAMFGKDTRREGQSAMKQFRTAASLFGLVGLAAMAPTAARAQDAVASAADDGDEIVVTAQRRAELSRDVPITITALSAESLETAGANQLTDIARVTPALRFDSAATFVQPTIRGVGTAVVNVGGGGNVGIYVDGFYAPNPAASDFDLLSLRSIQVLKGPQGTLFGRNTTGGAILVSTAEPGDTLGGEMKASYGRFDSWKLQGYVTAPLAEGIAVDLAGLYRRGDGYFTNDFTGDKRAGAYENWSVRTGLKVALSERISFIARYSHGDVDDPTMMNTTIYSDPVFGVGTNLPAAGYAQRIGHVTLDDPAESFTKSDVFQLTGKFDLGFADLTSYTQFRDESTRILEDLDHTSFKVFGIHILVDDETFSQEFLLTSKPGDRLQWTAGLFYLRYKDVFHTRLATPTPADRFSSLALLKLGTTTKTLADFADFTYEVTPRFFITAGARYAKDKVDDPFFSFPQPGIEDPVLTPVAPLKDHKVTPRVVLRYKPSDDSSVYVSYTKGYKAGLIDFGAFDRNAVKPEDIDAFEIGYKYDDRALAVELAGYYYDYKNLQVSLYKGANATAQVVNAADSTIYGIEGQVRYRVSDSFEVNAGASWTHARYKNFADAPIYTRCLTAECAAGGLSFVVVPTPLNDVTMQRTPSFTGNIGARYAVDLGGGQLDLSGNLYYTSKFYFGPSGVQFPQKGYEVLALRAEWTDPSEHFSLALFGDNVTNSRYQTQIQYNSFGVGSVWSAPATWGVQVGAKF